MGEKFAFVFLDTSFLREKRFSFESKRFKLFSKAVKRLGDLELALPSVIQSEIERHISIVARETNDAHREAHKAAGSWPYLQAIYPPKGDITQDVLSSLKAAWEKLQSVFAGVRVLPASTANLEDIVEWYIKVQAPFEDRESKKNEFPDAIAISSLLTLPQPGRIAVVSHDKGLLVACLNHPERLQGFDSLDPLTEVLGRNRKKIAAVHRMVEAAASPFRAELSAAFENWWLYLSDDDGEFEDASVDDVDSVEVEVLDLEGDSVEVAFNADVNVSAHVTFPDPDSYYKDDDTRTYVSMGNLHGTVVDIITLSGTCTLKVNWRRGRYEVANVQLDHDEHTFDQEDVVFTRDAEEEDDH